MVRDTVDKVALVEKLLHDLDKPKAEVVVDVIVMDVSSDLSHQIGAGLVSNGTNGLNLPIQFSPTNPITSSTTGATGTGGTGATSTTAPPPRRQAPPAQRAPPSLLFRNWAIWAPAIFPPACRGRCCRP